MPSIQHISVEEIRLNRRLMTSEIFKPPVETDLAPSIANGKAELDAITKQKTITPSSKNISSPPVKNIGGKFTIPKNSAIPLHGPFSYRNIEKKHLWIEIEKGRLAVLSNEQHEVMLDICNGLSLEETKNKNQTISLLKLIAQQGFIRGINGHVDESIVNASRFLRIHLTERCNLSCVHCYSDSGPNIKSTGELPPEKWIEIISNFAAAGGERILFTGGEALVYPNCSQLFKHSKNLGLHVTLFTNGILVPKYIDAIAESVDEVQVSIDGINSSSNDQIRGSGSFKKAFRAIDLLAKRNVSVKVSTVAMNANWDNLQSGFLTFAARWKNLPVSFKINYGVMTHGRGEEIKNEITINETRPIIDRLMESLYPDDSRRITRSTKGCGYAEQIVVAPNGGVHPCHLLSGEISNFNFNTIEEVLKQLKTTQDEFNVNTSIGCKTCDIRHLCGGTCRVENSKRTGNLRVTYCDAQEKLRKLIALKNTFSQKESQNAE